MLIDASFESGNIELIELKDKTLVVKPVRHQYEIYTLWFYFRLKHRKGAEITVVMPDRPADQDWSLAYPIYRSIGSEWERIDRTKLSVSANTLTFSLTLPSDVIELAYGYPYTLRDLEQFIHSTVIPAGGKAEIIYETKMHNPLYAIRLSPLNKTSKSLFIVFARIHSGESPGSFSLEGLIQYWIENVLPTSFLDTTLLIFPMVNVDGVVMGQNGKYDEVHDYCRNWDNPIHEEIKFIKRYMESFGLPIRIVIDLHAPSLCPGSEGAFWAYRLAKDIIPSNLYDNTTRFLSILKSTLPNPDRLDFNRTVSVDSGPLLNSASLYLARMYNTVGITIEHPFHWLPDTVITPEILREFGQSIAKTFVTFFFGTL